MKRLYAVAAFFIACVSGNVARADDFDDAVKLDARSHHAPTLREREQAQFDLAVTLHRIGLRDVALHSFFDIARRKEHLRHADVLPWLAVLALEIGELSDVHFAVGEYDEAAIAAVSDARARSTLFYELGRYAYETHDYDRAARDFALVDRASPFFARAQIQAGMAHFLQRRGDEAVGAFSRVVHRQR